MAVSSPSHPFHGSCIATRRVTDQLSEDCINQWVNKWARNTPTHIHEQSSFLSHVVHVHNPCTGLFQHIMFLNTAPKIKQGKQLFSDIDATTVYESRVWLYTFTTSTGETHHRRYKSQIKMNIVPVKAGTEIELTKVLSPHKVSRMNIGGKRGRHLDNYHVVVFKSKRRGWMTRLKFVTLFRW